MRTVGEDAIAHGVSFVMVDLPKSQTANRTLKSDKEEGIRPYLIHVPEKRLINFRFRPGTSVLTMVVIDETGYVPDGDFGERWVEKVRVIRPGAYEVISRTPDPNNKDKFTYERLETGPAPATLHVYAVYANKTGMFLGASPLQNLAELNLRHWQSQSDQNNILKFARVPIMTRTLGHATADEDIDDIRPMPCSGCGHLPLKNRIR
jgi:hypothetical protein